MQKRLSLGITSFKKIRDKNYIYVDKTDIIAKFVSTKGPHFLSRPRRFGKSTLIDTLDVLFSQGLEAFNGLKITQSDNNESLDEIKQRLDLTKTYKVLRLSFDKIDTLTPREIEIEYIKLLKKFFTSLNINIEDDAIYLFSVLKSGLEQLQEQIVLLIDEYDTPLTYYLDDSEKFKEVRNILSVFYKEIKEHVNKFRFIFITGITKYSNVSIFSAFNNLQDLSFNSKYGSIVGYTQEELEYYFKDYIQKSAVTLNEKEKTDIYTYDVILQKLKEHYDGYCFDRFASIHVYNPWSILNFLDEPQEGFIPYWLNSGGAMPSLLVKYLQRNNIADAKEFEQYMNLNATVTVKVNALVPSMVDISDKNFNLQAILYQAGYFTIKQVTRSKSFKIGVTNLEVKEAFANIILNNIASTSKESYDLLDFTDSLLDSFYAGDYNQVKNVLNCLINSLFSFNSIKCFTESLFVDLVYMYLIYAKASHVVKEATTLLGRSDLCFDIDDKRFVCEFKLAHNDKEVLVKLQEAKEQIQKRKYNMLSTNQEIISLAIVALNTKDDSNQDKACEIALIEKL